VSDIDRYASACWQAAGRTANRQDAEILHAAGCELVQLGAEAARWRAWHDALASEMETLRAERADANRAAKHALDALDAVRRALGAPVGCDVAEYARSVVARMVEADLAQSR